MVYVSSLAACPRPKMGAMVRELCDGGLREIELSGGTQYYSDLMADLQWFRQHEGVRYLCHNYFPPPRAGEFTLNLASLDDTVFQRSVEFLRRSLRWSRQLGADRFAFHAGYLLDIPPRELGQPIANRPLNDRMEAIRRFADGYEALSASAEGVQLYVEINVLSETNRAAFGGSNPLLLTCWEDYQALRQELDFDVLADVGHLHVNAHSLGLDFVDELACFSAETDYLHVSENDGRNDQHRPVTETSSIFAALSQLDLKGKVITLEAAGPMEEIMESHGLLEGLVGRGKARPR